MFNSSTPKKKSHVYSDSKPFCIIDPVTYIVKGTVSQEMKKKVAAFICYADSAEQWNKKR